VKQSQQHHKIAFAFYRLNHFQDAQKRTERSLCQQQKHAPC